MRITLRMDGGLAYLPGLSRPRTLDLEALPTPERERICALIDGARASAAARRSASQTKPDARTYTIDVEDGDRNSTLTLTEPFGDASCASLVAVLREHLDRRG